MFNESMRFVRSALSSCTTICMLAMVTWSGAQAGHDQLSCKIKLDEGSTWVGVPIALKAKVEDEDDHVSYSWDLSDGPGSPDTASTMVLILPLSI